LAVSFFRHLHRADLGSPGFKDPAEEIPTAAGRKILRSGQRCAFTGIGRARQRMTMMIDDQLARMRTHRDNIYCYRHLLQTKLTELERDFIERRLAEEQSSLERLAVLLHPATSAA